MKTVARMALQKGMVIGEDILDYQGRLVYKAGTEVDDLVIQKLKQFSIIAVSVLEEIDYAKTHYEKIRFDNNFKAFEILYAESIRRYKSLVQTFIQTKVKIENTKLMSIYYDIRSAVPSNNALFDYLYNMVPTEEIMTYAHCLNAALIAGVFSDWLGLRDHQKTLLILCGFYYDIGKLMLPYDLLWKPGRLTPEEYQLLQSHTMNGYLLVKDLDIDEHIKNAVLQHHERMDGTGYPQKRKANEIDVCAKYLSIIDTYEAMASPRVWRGSIPPLRIIETFEYESHKYDMEILLPLLKRIADAQIGSHVKLSDDTEWEVFIINPTKLSRPLLKNEQSEILDLMKRPDLVIEKMV